MDFSAFETAEQGTWQLGGVIDYYSEIVLACEVTATQTAADLCAALDAAEAQAQALVGRPLAQACAEARTGEICPIAVVTDNGPAMKPAAATRWFAARPHRPSAGRRPTGYCPRLWQGCARRPRRASTRASESAACPEPT